MKIVKDASLSLLHQVFGWRGRDRLSMAVIAGFNLDERQCLVTEADLWDQVTAELGRNRVLDLCMPKPKGEVLVLGKCFAGGDREVQGATAFFRVGRLEKRVEVFGDRYFKLGLMGSKYIKPKPFSVMDISWENAFGGPGYGLNPVGKGMLPVHTTEGDRLVPMPNIENPARMMTAPDDRPEPAGMGPMGLNWPARLKGLGAFDRRWLVERWPGLPDDFNFEYYNLAPVDQRVDGTFQGNEFVLIRGMHPDDHEIQTKLPNLRCRLFINQADNDESSFREIPANLDTVYLIPHLALGLLIWHGATPVSDDEAGDVRHIAAFHENLDDTPRSMEFYRQKLDQAEEETAKAVDPPPLEQASLEPPPLEPPPLEPAIGASELPDPPIPEADLALAASLENEIAEKEALLNQRLREWGIDPESIEQPAKDDMIPPPREDISPEALMDKMERSALEQEKKLDRLMKCLGMDPEGAPPDPPPVPKGPDMSNAGVFLSHFIQLGVTDPESLDGLRELYEEHQAASLELAAWHDRLRLAEAEAPPVEAREPIEDEKPATRPYTRERVQEDYQNGRHFSGADLTGLDLSDCPLPGIDLSGAVLERINLSGCDLTGSKMDGALLAGADLTGSRLTDASLSKISAVEANFADADLSRSNLAGSDFSNADFSRSNLSGAWLNNSVLNGAQLAETNGSGLRACGADFQDSVLTGSIFENAELKDADLSGATLDKVNFQGIHAQELRLYGAKGQNTDFCGAQLTRSRSGEDTCLAGARFTGADLTGAAWEETDLTGADFSGARMPKAKINQCRLPESTLSGVFARGADFSKSDLSRAKMTGIDLLGGSLRKAHLAETDLRIANLFAVDVYKAQMTQTRVQGANLERTLLTIGHAKLK